MSKLEESDDDDWFDKDEEELLKDLKIKVEKAKNNFEETTEYIEATGSYDEDHMQQLRLNASAIKTPQNLPKIQTSDLRKLAEKDIALDAFLYALTIEKSNFFQQQISANDSLDRVLIYVHLYAMIAELKVPNFHKSIIEHFTKDDQLLDQLCMITTKIFTERYKTLWKTDQDKVRLDKFIKDIQLLFLQANALNLLTSKTILTLKHIKRLYKTSDSKDVLKRPIVLEFERNLKEILTDDKEVLVEDVAASTADLECNKKSNDIYPTLKELLADDTTTDPLSNITLSSYDYKSISEYLTIQKLALHNDFMRSLIDCIKELKSKQQLNDALASTVILFENVEIILNDNFLNARRHEMLFVNILPERKTGKAISQLKHELKSLKTGSLICLTTSYDFDDLILAVVTHQDAEFSANCCVAIEIVHQYNIGSVYNQKLIMLTSPVFFEPYRNVYNYLSTCSVDDFPMKDIIVFGKHDISPPNYMTEKTIYQTEKVKFKPLQEATPTNLPLNSSQREAFQKAITQKFTLVQGPPGTGKTHLSVQLVKLLLENVTPPKPIVIVAYTNESLDKFLLKISNFTSSIARLGGQTRLPEISKFNIQGPVTGDHVVNPHLKRLYYVVNMEFKEAFKALQSIQNDFDGTEEGYELVLKAHNKVRIYAEQLNTIRLIFNYYLLRERSIVALTTTCAAKMNFLFRLLGCKIVIFEEAAEILESHVLACLTPKTEHVIMIGDHMQLKPYTSNYQHSRTCDFNVSLFERLIKRGTLCTAVLSTQYRMRPIITELMTPLFYDKLNNDASVEQYPLVRGMFENFYFVEHDEPEKQTKQMPSYCNQHEIHEIINLAKYLIEANYKTKDIVILSPYAGQCDRFKERLPTNLKPIRVMTVDSFQGLEAKIVLLSLVRSNNDAQIGFLREKNRVCVALSRAKHGFYLIGNLKMLSSSCKLWREIEQKLNSLQLVGKTFPYAEDME